MKGSKRSLVSATQSSVRHASGYAARVAEQITDPADDRVRDYVGLRDVNLRKSLEAREGLFIAEGEKVIRRAVEAGFEPRSFLLAERWLPGLSDVLQRHPDAPVYIVTEALAEQISGFHVHRGALASMRRATRHTLDDLLACRRLVVCEDIVDHTNVGAIIRTAAGLGWDGVALSPGAADPLYRRAIKTAMGAVFSLPWARLNHPRQLTDAGFTVVATALREDARELAEVAAEAHRIEKLALLVGTEGAGLSPAWQDAADVMVRIPMAHGVDSLNVGAATAICCYALR